MPVVARAPRDGAEFAHITDGFFHCRSRKRLTKLGRSHGGVAAHAALAHARPPVLPWQDAGLRVIRYPGSICKHGLESVTVFSLVINLNERRAWIGRGRPCETTWVEHRLEPWTPLLLSPCYGIDWKPETLYQKGARHGSGIRTVFHLYECTGFAPSVRAPSPGG
jgi:hypothetical protein